MMLDEILSWPPNHWHWWTFAVLLLICELLLPAAYFLGLSIAAGLIGLWLFFSPGMDWDWQLFSFAITSLVTVTLWRRYSKAREPVSDHPTLNRRSAQYIGRVVTVDHPVVNGVAQVKLDGTLWRLRCGDLQVGGRVRITGVDGADLLGEPVDDG